jgi:SAM-dependent methyltransferase
VKKAEWCRPNFAAVGKQAPKQVDLYYFSVFIIRSPLKKSYHMDKSNGYEAVAPAFIKYRGQTIDGIGASKVRNWCRTLPSNSTVLDIGCGTGIPISKVLMDEGITVYGVDASPTMVEAFRQHFPNVPVACEAVEDSSFFNRRFDAVIAWGLYFLLPEAVQTALILKIADALHTGGKFLFTAPCQQLAWVDVMTGWRSISLGAGKYRELLVDARFTLLEESRDEGENYYYNAIKLAS